MPEYRMSSRESSSEPYEHGLVGPPGAPPIRNGSGDGDGNGDGNGGPSSNPNLRAVAVEATQATQFFNFNGQGTGTAGNNSVPLIPQKTTVFRVYTDSGQWTPDFPAPTSITGALGVYRLNWPQAPHYENVATLSPIGFPIAGRPASAIQRASLQDTLNFRLPAWQSYGGNTNKLGVTAYLWDADHPGDAAYVAESFVPPYFSFVPSGVQTRLRLHVVRIRYLGPDNTGAPITIPEPSELAVTNTLSNSFVSRTYPVSGIDYAAITIAEFNGDLRATGGSGCGLGWDALIQMLRDIRSASSSADIIVGILPSGAPTVGGVAGCGSLGVAAAYQGDAVSLAHEIGHAMGRLHAPCAATPLPVDPSYPAYPTGPPGSIGEVGIDGATLTPFAPGGASPTFDFMSYCPPKWVSPYTYNALFSYQHIFAS